MNQNQDFRFLHYPLPPDVVRLRESGDLNAAIRLIDKALAENTRPEMAARLRVERERLVRLPAEYPYPKDQAMTMMRKEWPDMTDEQFQALMDNGRVDWRFLNGQIFCHDDFIETSRNYPLEAPGLKSETEDTSARDQMLARMKAEGGAGRPHHHPRLHPAQGACPRRPRPGLAAHPRRLPPAERDRAAGVHPGWPSRPGGRPPAHPLLGQPGGGCVLRHLPLPHPGPLCGPVHPHRRPGPAQFPPPGRGAHMLFTPYLRDLTARITDGCSDALEKARAIYDYVTGTIDYRYQPSYFQLEPIAELCARQLRGDCGVMAVLFITLCRIAGIPAQWQSGLSVKPGYAGCHDWAMFYVAPHGWLWADPSFGSGARRAGDQARRDHYFGNLDPCRMVANRVFMAPFTPPDPAWRSDPTDNQLGEMVVNGRGLLGSEMVRKAETLDFEYLPY